MHRSAVNGKNDYAAVPIVDDVVVKRLLTLRDQVAKPGEDVLGDLLSLFERDTRTRLEAIRSAVSHANADERKNAAHALKGSAGNVGAQRVAAIAAFVEKNWPAHGDLERLELEVAEALAVLRARLAPGR
jgi:HPt (histidine-containing phosphotransfer) domain-containing protein